LQTAIQIGAFAGNFLGGFILQQTDFKGILITLLVTLFIGSLLPIFVQDIENIPIINNHKAKDDYRSNKSNNILLLSLLTTAIGILTIQISAFNFNVPVIFYDLKNWSSSTFGIVSAFAGLGALLATLIPRFKILDSYIFILILVSNIILSFTISNYMAIVFAFILGFSMNTTRISLRKTMYEHIHNDNESVNWSGKVTGITQISKTIAPIMFGIVLSFYGNHIAPYIFVGIGVIVLLFISIIRVKQFNLERDFLNEKNRINYEERI
jgi:MFS family permease